MLWLAGLMGIAGVGAATFVGIKADVSEDDEEDYLAQDTDQMTDVNALMEQIKDHSDTDGLLQTQASVEADAAPKTAPAGGWGDDILNDVMADLDGGTDGTAEVNPLAQPSADIVYSSAMLAAEDVDIDIDTPQTDVLLSEWIDQRDGPEILDYEAKTESLMLVWDDTGASAAEPEVGVAPDPDDPEVMQVSMNGENVAEVYGDAELSVADLTLIPLSSAMVIGLEAV